MKKLLALLLVLFSVNALADYPCLPIEYGGIGQYTSLADTPYAKSITTSCPNAPDPARTVYTWTWLKDYVPSATCSMAIAPAMAAKVEASLTSKSLLPLVNAATAACQSIPAAGTVEREHYDQAQLLSQTMTRSKYAADQPAPGAEVWRTPSTGGLMYSYSAGKLGSPIFTKRASGNALCNCTVARATSGSSTYCALDGGATNEVAFCQKR